MGRRKIPRINFNLLAAAIIGLVVAAGLAFTAWRPESRMEALLQNLGRQVAAEGWEQAEATLRTVEEEWHKRRTWLLLNNSRNAVLRFEEQLARVRAGVSLRHGASAAVDAEELHAVWQEFAG